MGTIKNQLDDIFEKLMNKLNTMSDDSSDKYMMLEDVISDIEQARDSLSEYMEL